MLRTGINVGAGLISCSFSFSFFLFAEYTDVFLSLKENPREEDFI